MVIIVVVDMAFWDEGLDLGHGGGDLGELHAERAAEAAFLNGI